ncbi:hypothetical protein Tco_0122490 [Tanacetum coccineum]
MSLFKVPKAVLMIHGNLNGGMFSMVFVMARKRLLGLAGLRFLRPKVMEVLWSLSLYALNRGLLCLSGFGAFLSGDHSLWPEVHFALHGSTHSLLFIAPICPCGVLLLKNVMPLNLIGLDLIISHCKIRVGNGMSIRFLANDQWFGDSSFLSVKLPRLFALENYKVCRCNRKMSAPFVSSLRRDVRGGEESAQLSRISDLLLRCLLDDMSCLLNLMFRLDGSQCSGDPIKVNVLAWKISMEIVFLLGFNLHRRGVQVSLYFVSYCCGALE